MPARIHDDEIAPLTESIPVARLREAARKHLDTRDAGPARDEDDGVWRRRRRTRRPYADGEPDSRSTGFAVVSGHFEIPEAQTVPEHLAQLERNLRPFDPGLRFGSGQRRRHRCRGSRGGAEYVLTGRQLLTQFEQVSTIGRAIGRSLSIEGVSPEEARREWAATWPAPVVNMLLKSWNAAIGQPAYVTNSVAEVTGTPARTFFDWASDHARAFRA